MKKKLLKAFSLYMMQALILTTVPVAMAEPVIEVLLDESKEWKIEEAPAMELDQYSEESEEIVIEGLDLDDGDMGITDILVGDTIANIPDLNLEEVSELQTNDTSGDIKIDAEHFPDDRFRSSVARVIDTNADGVLSIEERTAVTKYDCTVANIFSLEGIAYFPSMEELDVSINNLTNLDLSACTHLGSLDCSGNKLETLEISNCSELYTLRCYHNQLRVLDISGCPYLIQHLQYEPEKYSDGVISFESGSLMIDMNTTVIADGKTLYSMPSSDQEVSGKCGESVNYILNREGVMTISGSGRMWDFRNDSDEFDYHECPWKDSKDLIKTVVFKRGITHIGASSFSECMSLQKVTFSDSILAIGAFAFFEAIHLDNFTLPSKLEFIGQNAFGRTNIKTIDIPGSVYYVDAGICEECKNLRSVMFRAHVDGIYGMGNSPFKDCPSLEHIEVESRHNALHSDNGVLYSSTTLIQYPLGKRDIAYRVEKGCEEILQFALQGATFREISLPDSLSEIGIQAFGGCKNLETVNYEGTKARWKKIKIGDMNKPLLLAKRNYNVTEGYEVPLSSCKITVKDQTYTGKALKPAVTVKYGSKALKKGADYTVSYKNNKAVGVATVTVTGKGGYTGTKKLTFNILPRAVTISKLTAGKQLLTVKWGRRAEATGYELQYAMKSSFAGAKTVKIKKNATVSATIKKLKTGKTYYVRLRSYKTVGKKTYYSAWSKGKSVKVK